MRSRKVPSWALAVLTLVLLVVPFIVTSQGRFGGSDDSAKREITQIDQSYKPWFTPLWTPPSPDVESLLFALQASTGTAFIAYFLGYRRGRRAGSERHAASDERPASDGREASES